MIHWNNFKIAFRVLRKDKFNSAINLVGLTIGISCFLLLGLHVKQELSYDQFHAKKDRIYRTWLKEDYGEGKVFFSSHTPLRFEKLLEDNFPEVETAVQYIVQNNLVGRGENRINERIAVISPEFFNVFDFPLLEGNQSSPFSDKNSLAISRGFAQKYFNEDNPTGKVLPIQFGDEIREFIISAVFEDMPLESSIMFDLAISNENNPELFGKRSLEAWFTIIPETYVLLKENTTVAAVNAKMQDVVMSYLSDEVERDQYNIGLQALTDIHLNPDIPVGNAPVSNPQYVIILGTIGLLVLIIGCINYTTLTAGQSLKRNKEVGMRKVLGAKRTTLLYQYLSESILLALAAMLIGTVVTLILIPAFNELAGTNIIYQFEWWHVGMYLLLGLTVGIIAGSYPALVISGFQVITLFRGMKNTSQKIFARKGLVVFQFMVTVFLISTTLIMKKQINYLQEKDLGYNYKAVVAAQLVPDPAANRFSQVISTGMANGELLKTKLEKHPEISGIAMGTHVFGTSGWAQLAYTDPAGVFRRFRVLTTDAHYLDAFNIKIQKGRNFEEGNGLDQRQSIILNETAVKYFGLEKPIGAKLPGKDFGEHRIIGVTEDFNFSSLHTKVEPLIIVQNIIPLAQGVSDSNIGDTIVPKLVFTYSGTDLSRAGEILEQEWETLFPNESWNYHFIDERIKAQYESEVRLNKLITAATFLSITIAGLGLLGLILLMINAKEKEIGIRKVMGASPITIFRLLSRSFAMQLILAIAISIPCTVWLMNSWLENFAYSIGIGVDVFLVSGLASVLLAGLVIGYYTIKAANINPVKSLRTE